ncbi:hypothetical protein [Candidatus Entotheonella palauensis]|uniref:hypothetical protein n=1 Tax=Candidatus Entotheonella palauensis TaxID=93172 RepID=UPI002117391A|nr:hypothetical protein [Candidatus Entotheonella palauensis]
MAITHVNAKDKPDYLHQGTTKTGKPTYHFAMKSEGTLADSIPEGFEIYENPNAQVFLRRILTTHAGRLPNPDNMAAILQARDELYFNSRFTGVEMQPLQPGEWPSILEQQQERHMPEFREFYAVYDQLGNIPRPGVVNPRPTHKAVITGPMQYKGQDVINHELAVVKAGIAAAEAQVEDFFPLLGSGWLGHFLFNAYYPAEEEYVYAMAEGAALATRQL